LEYVFLVFALLFISFGQILQKRAAVGAAKQASGARFLYRLAKQKETWLAVICLMAGTLFWLAVLYRMEVSKVLPFFSVSTVLVLLASRFYLGETIGRTGWAGVVAIVIGIALLSQS